MNGLEELLNESSFDCPTEDEIIRSDSLIVTFKPNGHLPGTGGCPLCPSGLKEQRRNVRYLSVNGREYNLFIPLAAYIRGHFVLASLDHRPLTQTEAEVRDLLAFSRRYPEATVAANNGLTRIGGSIPGHLHFQLIDRQLPVVKAPCLQDLSPFDELQIHILEWPLSAVRIIGTEDDIVRHYGFLLKNYAGADRAFSLLSFMSGEKPGLIVVFRSRLADTAPERLFLKSSGIGVLEAGGLFVLDQTALKARLQSVKALQDGGDFPAGYENMRGQKRLESGAAQAMVDGFILETAKRILCDTDVFKSDRIRAVKSLFWPQPISVPKREQQLG